MMSGPLAFHLRAELRRRWPAWVAVVVLVGLVGGLVLGASAGARRTASAFDRMVRDTETSEVLVNPNEGTFSDLDPAEVAELPGVLRTGIVDGGGGIIVAADGSFDGATQVFVQRDPRILVEFERPLIVDGRMLDPHDPGGIVLSDDVADRHDVEAGDTLTVGTMTMEELEAWEQSGDPEPPLTLLEQRVEGIVVTPETVVTDEVYQFGQAFLPFAFGQEHRPASYYYGIVVDLDGGHDAVPGFQAALRSLVPDEQFEFKTLAASEDTVRRGVRPHVVAVMAFVILVGMAGTIVSGQAVTRQLVPLLNEAATLRALGAGDRDLRRAMLLRSLAIALPGAVLAVVGAIAISPLFPLGVARRAETDPGISVDLVVLAPGVAVLVAALVLWPVLAVRRLRRAGRTPDRAPAALERLARATNRPVLATGLRSALTPSAGRSEASPRGALAGLTVAVGAVAAAATFGAGLLHLIERPAAYGWAWDAMVAPPGDDDHLPVIRERIENDPAFTGTVELSVDQLRIGTARVPAVGFPTDEVAAPPTVVAGRLPASGDEIALGGRTMAALDVGLGDRIEVGEDGHTATLAVVGQAVFPGIGTYSGADRTELGKGALLDRDTLADVGEGFDAGYIGIRARDRESLEAGLTRVTEGFEAALEEGELEIITEPQRPSDVRSLESVRRTPEVIAAVLAVLAGAALCFVLVAGIRGRRRELTLLRTFGFRGRDLAATVVCQSVVTAVIAIGIGMPLGVVVGRRSWSALAGSLGVAPAPQVPFSLVGVAAGVLVLAALVALVPGMLAARVRPGVVLRAE